MCSNSSRHNVYLSKLILSNIFVCLNETLNFLLSAVSIHFRTLSLWQILAGRQRFFGGFRDHLMKLQKESVSCVHIAVGKALSASGGAVPGELHAGLPFQWDAGLWECNLQAWE